MYSVEIILSTGDEALTESWLRLLLRGGWRCRRVDARRLGSEPAGAGLVFIDLAAAAGATDGFAGLKAACGGRALLLTSRSPMPDSVVAGALEAGVDDYILEADDERLRLAKLRAHLRRQVVAAPASDMLASPKGDLRLDAGKRVVERAAAQGRWLRLAALTPIESRILRELLTYAGAPLERPFLTEKVWREKAETILPATVDKHVEALRRKLGAWSKCVRTVYGTGYGYMEA